MRLGLSGSSQKRAWHFARWPLLFALLGAFFFLVGISAVRETYRAWEIDQEVRGLQAQIDALEGKKSSLTELMSRLNDPGALDREARARLGLRKPGERVFAIPEELLNPSGSGSATSTASSATTTRVSNPMKWFSYFFRS